MAASAWFMESPPRQLRDDVARERVEAFIRGEDDETLTGRDPRWESKDPAAQEAASEATAIA